MTETEREIITHSLGLNRRRKPYRNYYCAANGDPELEALCAKGMMRQGRTLNDERDRYYYVTEAGSRAVGARLLEDK